MKFATKDRFWRWHWTLGSFQWWKRNAASSV